MRRPRPLRCFARLGLGVLLLAACAAARPPQQDAGALLAPARIAGLPAAERAAWETYLERSRTLRAQDRAALAAEVRAAGLERALQAPAHDGFFLEDHMTEAWFAGDSARALADGIVSWQTPAGGWSKRTGFERPRRPGESWASQGNQGWIGTFDNGATTEQLRFFARITNLRAEPRYRDAFLRGVEYLLAAQFPNGCWPQVFPLVGSYHDAATFNDDATANVLRVLHAVARGEPAFVPAALRARAAAGARHGIDCVLRAQVVVNGRPAIWGQQHDPLTLDPVPARAYEHRSLASRESAGLANLLLTLEQPDARVRRALRGAAAWFRENALYGYEYEPRSGRTARPGAGPLWPRFAEIGTNRAIFSNRDGVVLHDFEQLDEERRTGYAWYTDEPATTLRRYRAWASRQDTVTIAPPRAGEVSAVVAAGYRGADGAHVQGVPTFRTIAAALAAAPADASPWVIVVRDGRYHEKLHVERPNVHLLGESVAGTVLSFAAAAGAPSPEGFPWGTRGTATLRVAAPGFRLARMTVENGFDYLAGYALPADDPARLRDLQGVAVHLDEGSDRAVFRECRIRGHQDTLFPDAGRSWFFGCTIEGSVDFIFGAGRAVFEESDIVSRDRGSRRRNGYIAAPSTPSAQPFGFLFLRSRLRRESPALAAGSVMLGRPWHPGGDPGAIGSAVYIECWLDDHIAPAGWMEMFSTDAAGQRVRHDPAAARFFEYGSTGPGAHASPGRRRLGEEEARRYTRSAVLAGWDPGR